MFRILTAVPGNRVGGIHVRTLRVAEGLRKLDVETVFLTSADNLGDFDILAQDKGFLVFHVGKERLRSLSHFVGNLRWLWEIPFNVRKINKIIKTQDIDIVHTNGLLTIAPAIAAKFSRRKLIWHLEGNHYPIYLVSLLSKFVNITSNKIVLVAESLFAYYKVESHEFKNICIKNPVDAEYFSKFSVSTEISKRLRNDLGIRDTDYVVMSVGNVTRSKGLEYFVEAADQILKQIKNVKFFIIGPKLTTQDTYWNSLQNQVQELGLSESIFFLGKRNDVRELLTLCDVFLMTSIFEGAPLAILEAMAMEVPVVATNIAGIPEQIIHGENGFLAAPTNSSESAKYTIKLLCDTSLRRNMAASARKRILEEYSLDKCINQHLSLYKSLI